MKPDFAISTMRDVLNLKKKKSCNVTNSDHFRYYLSVPRKTVFLIVYLSQMLLPRYTGHIFCCSRSEQRQTACGPPAGLTGFSRVLSKCDTAKTQQKHVFKNLQRFFESLIIPLITFSCLHFYNHSLFFAPILIIKNTKQNLCRLHLNVTAADFFRMNDPPFLLL